MTQLGAGDRLLILLLLSLIILRLLPLALFLTCFTALIIAWIR
jgi:hypothetical protein